MLSLYEQLLQYSESDYYPFHMPGHKRSKFIQFNNPFQFDITEIEGFDNLHHSESILLDAQERAAKLYNSSETHFLVNGSTSGLLSAISSCTTKGGTILMARNCHKAVYNAVFLNELKIIHTYPQKDNKYSVNCGLNTREIKQLLVNNKNIQAVVITSPTYDGIVSDIKSIAKEVHKYNIPLIVDEAHGAHFGFHTFFPDNAISLGADIVIHSVHKTLPSLTQTALLHVNGNIVDRDKLRKYLSIYQTSSPSYVLMASIDNCINLISNNGKELFSKYVDNLTYLRNELSHLKNINIVNEEIVGNYSVFDLDKSKLIISVKGTDITGKDLYYKLLNEYHLQMEMAAGDYVLAMTSIMDSIEGYDRLIEALYKIDSEINKINNCDISNYDTKGYVTDVYVTDINITDDYVADDYVADDYVADDYIVDDYVADDYIVDDYVADDYDTDDYNTNNYDTNNYDTNDYDIKDCGNEEFVTNSYGTNKVSSYNNLISRPITEYSIAETSKFKTIEIEFEKADGTISAEYIYLYPPGVPLIVPGEVISKQLINQINIYRKNGLLIEGMKDFTGRVINVIDDKS